MSGSLLLIPFVIEISMFDANSVDFDQAPPSVASDLGSTLFANVPF